MISPETNPNSAARNRSAERGSVTRSSFARQSSFRAGSGALSSQRAAAHPPSLRFVVASRAAPRLPLDFGLWTLDRAARAFSLLELLVVLAIIGILAAVALPNIKNFTPNISASAGRQLLAEVNHARQLAISQHTTVYMVFVPTNFWADPLGTGSSALYNALPPSELTKATNLFDKQLIGYNFVTLRSLGDQPGHPIPRYLGPWKTLPDGAFIPLFKFYAPFSAAPLTIFYTNTSGAAIGAITNAPFRTTNNIPFPSEYNTNGPYITLPYIAFNYQGQLVNGNGQLTYSNNCETIPLTAGHVLYGRNAATKIATMDTPSVKENPIGNTSNSYNVVNIDFLTGRARLEHQEVQ